MSKRNRRMRLLAIEEKNKSVNIKNWRRQFIAIVTASALLIIVGFLTLSLPISAASSNATSSFCLVSGFSFFFCALWLKKNKKVKV